VKRPAFAPLRMILALLAGVFAIASSVPAEARDPKLRGAAYLDAGKPIAAEAAPAAPAETDLAALVSPFVGTGRATGKVKGAPGGGDGGNTFPGASLPFGMIAWSPDTSSAFTPALDQAGSYVYDDTAIRGFSLTHMSGPGCPAYGSLPFMPVIGPISRSPASSPERYWATFTHAGEQAAPGSYGVGLVSSGIRVELAVTARTGFGRFTFPAVPEATVLVDTGASAAASIDQGSFDGAVEIAGENRITGFATGGKFCWNPDRYTLYFAAEFDRPFAKVGTWSGDEVHPGARAAGGRRAGAFVSFDATRERAVQVKVGISYVSVENALANLRAESPGFKLDGVRAAGRAAWNQALGRARVDGGTVTERRIFYTALYHSLLHPNVFSDGGGQYLGFDRRVHQARGYTAYANFSGWDIYRSQVQLLALLFPREAADMARSLLDAAEAGGAAPRWSSANNETGVMVGDPAAAIIAGIHAFGATSFPAARALARLAQAADRPGARSQGYEIRPGLGAYLDRGYIPLYAHDVWGPAATTLEYATADFSVAALAGALGDRATRARFMRRAQSWQRLYDPAVDLIRPRLDSGPFVPDFETDPARPVGPTADAPWDHGQLGFVEGNAWQYTWMVPFNLAGLFRAMGGRDRAVARLDAFFEELNAGTERPHYYMGNEPQFAAPWAYTFAGAPRKSQETVRRILTTLFTDEPAGLPGNDDLGATSAWYVWAALGLYPAIPGVGGLVLGAPLFPSARLAVGGGRRALEITAAGAGAGAPYVEAVTLDRRPHPSTWLPVGKILRGGKLAFTLGAGAAPNVPNAPGAAKAAGARARGVPDWGTRPEDAPPSFDEGSAPAILFVARSGFLALGRGQAAAVPLGVRAGADRHAGAPLASLMRWSAEAPHPLELTPGSGTIGDGAALRISAPSLAPHGCYTVGIRSEATASGARGAWPDAAFEVAVSDDPLAPAFNHKGTSRDTVRAEGDFDRAGASYSAEALYEARLAPDAAVTHDGLTFVWPGGCALDHVVADGQTVDTHPAGRAGKLGFLGAADGAPGGAHGAGTITYTDGSAERFDLGLSDWTLGGGKARPAFGNRIAATLPYRNRRGGRDETKTYVFYTAVNLQPGKTIKSVTLPAANDVKPGRLHLFSMTTGD
jgi:predicted alpha-1,2-mannosidase